jgi:hypothetical protein
MSVASHAQAPTEQQMACQTGYGQGGGPPIRWPPRGYGVGGWQNIARQPLKILPFHERRPRTRPLPAVAAGQPVARLGPNEIEKLLKRDYLQYATWLNAEHVEPGNEMVFPVADCADRKQGFPGWAGPIVGPMLHPRISRQRPGGREAQSDHVCPGAPSHFESVVRPGRLSPVGGKQIS